MLCVKDGFVLTGCSRWQHVSSDQNPGGDYTTQLYRDYNKPIIRIPINQPDPTSISWFMSARVCFTMAACVENFQKYGPHKVGIHRRSTGGPLLTGTHLEDHPRTWIRG